MSILDVKLHLFKINKPKGNADSLIDHGVFSDDSCIFILQLFKLLVCLLFLLSRTYGIPSQF